MKKIELTLVCITIIGVTMRLLNIAGGGILTSLSLMTLSFIYMFFGFIILNNIRTRSFAIQESYQGISIVQIIGSIIAGFTLSLATLAVLFYFQNWEGAGIMSYISITIIGLLSLAGLVCHLIKKPLLSKASWIRFAIFALLLIYFLFFVIQI